MYQCRGFPSLDQKESGKLSEEFDFIEQMQNSY